MSLKYSILTILLAYAFKTSAVAQINIFVVGDTRSNYHVHEAVVNMIAQESYTAVVNTGDLVTVGSNESQWKKFIQIIKPLIPDNSEAPGYFPVLGNHDLSGDGKPYEFWHQYLPWLPGNGKYYCQDFENLRMIFLNSTSRNDNEQRDSLKHWLDSNKQEWVIVTWHHPTFPFGKKRIDSESLKEWWPLLFEAEVDLVLNGHAHYYARSYPLKPLPEVSSCAREEENGIIQVISGGAGAGLYPIGKDKHNQAYYDHALAFGNDETHHYGKISVTDSTLTFRAMHLDGKTFDRFSLTKK